MSADTIEAKVRASWERGWARVVGRIGIGQVLNLAITLGCLTMVGLGAALLGAVSPVGGLAIGLCGVLSVTVTVWVGRRTMRRRLERLAAFAEQAAASERVTMELGADDGADEFSRINRALREIAGGAQHWRGQVDRPINRETGGRPVGGAASGPGEQGGL